MENYADTRLGMEFDLLVSQKGLLLHTWSDFLNTGSEGYCWAARTDCRGWGVDRKVCMIDVGKDAQEVVVYELGSSGKVWVEFGACE